MEMDRHRARMQLARTARLLRRTGQMQGRKGVEYGEGVSPFPVGVGSGDEVVPLPPLNFVFEFLCQNACILGRN